MNREDIIRFGEQADEVADRKIKMRGEYHPDWHQVRDEAFAALVAAHEREVCERLVWNTFEPDDEYVSHREAIAKAIRERGNS